MDIRERAATCEALKFFNTADADNLLTIVTDPDGNRVAPVPVAREAPIASILEPVVETPLLDEAGDPASRLVQFD